MGEILNAEVAPSGSAATLTNSFIAKVNNIVSAGGAATEILKIARRVVKFRDQGIHAALHAKDDKRNKVGKSGKEVLKMGGIKEAMGGTCLKLKIILERDSYPLPVCPPTTALRYPRLTSSTRRISNPTTTPSTSSTS